MSDSDFVSRFLLEDLDIRGAFVRLGESWRKLQEGRGYPDPVRDLLGEMTAVAVLIAGNLKQPGRLGFQLTGSGPVRLLVVHDDICNHEYRFDASDLDEIFSPESSQPRTVH